MLFERTQHEKESTDILRCVNTLNITRAFAIYSVFFLSFLKVDVQEHSEVVSSCLILRLFKFAVA